MTKKITTREWEALSAYLDGQLAQKERARLENGLREDQNLRMALDELRQTRTVLRSQPKLRSPRNFTLTPAMVGRRVQPRSTVPALPVFRLASVLATLMLVVVFAGDFLTNRQPAAISMSALAPAATEVSPFAAQVETNPYPDIGQGEAVPAPNQKLMAVQPTPEATAQPGMGVLAEAPSFTAEPTVEAPAQSQAGPEVLSEPSGGTGAPLEMQPQQDGQTLAENPLRQSESPEEPADTTASQPAVERLPWRVAEAALALIALFSGLAAYFIHRSGNA